MHKRSAWVSTYLLSLVLLLNIAGCPQGDTNVDGGGDSGTNNDSGRGVGVGANTNGSAGGATGTNDGSGTDVGPTDRETVTPSTPILFVGDKNGGLLSFKNPASLNGDVAPTTRIFGTFNVREDAVALAVDRFGDLLSLSSDIGLAVFNGAETAAGDLSPNRRLTGSDTQLTHDFTLNSALLYDRSADRLFACNASAILVWDNVSALDGNAAPTRSITSPDLNGPRSMALGPNGDLYVTATTHVAVFKNAAARDGDLRADRVIRFLDESSVIAGTTITVDTVFVDGADRLYVYDSEPGAIIFVLDNAAALDGVVAPNRTIDIELAPTTPGSFAPEFFPAAMTVDSSGTGYVADFGQDAIHIIPNIGARDGVLPAEQSIAGPNTQFDEIGGLFIWE